MSGAHLGSTTLTEPGQSVHGWQFYASSVSEHHFRKTVILAQSCPSDQAPEVPLRRRMLSRAPRVSYESLSSLWRQTCFRIVLERLRLPLPVTEARCDCGALTDSRGRHWAACPHSGRLRSRAVAPEKTLADLQGGWGNCSCER